MNIFFFIDDLPQTLEQGYVGNSLEKEATFYIIIPRSLLLLSSFFSKHHPESRKENYSPMRSSIQYISGALFATTAIANLSEDLDKFKNSEGGVLSGIISGMRKEQYHLGNSPEDCDFSHNAITFPEYMRYVLGHPQFIACKAKKFGHQGGQNSDDML